MSAEPIARRAPAEKLPSGWFADLSPFCRLFVERFGEHKGCANWSGEPFLTEHTILSICADRIVELRKKADDLQQWLTQRIDEQEALRRQAGITPEAKAS